MREVQKKIKNRPKGPFFIFYFYFWSYDAILDYKIETDSAIKTTNRYTNKMTTEMDNAINEMRSDAVVEAVKVLAEKYGFDLDEAEQFLNQNLDVKLVRGYQPSYDNNNFDKDSKLGASPKPKRKLSGYLRYSHDARPIVKMTLMVLQPAGTKLNSKTVVCEIAKMWSALSDEERAVW